MEGLKRRFSHVAKFTGYMRIVADLVDGHRPGLTILDVPAGNGLLADALRRQGHDVVAADINGARPDYVHADLEAGLPFPDDAFDVTVCLEGVEHLVGQSVCLRELVRVTRPGGRIVISTPNVQNFYSRVTFLFGGWPYQFSPLDYKPVALGQRDDRGHIAPIGLYELAYLMATFGAPLEHTCGDHVKKKVLLPLFGVLFPVIALVSLPVIARLPAFLLAPGADRRRLFFNRHTLLSRSLIGVFRKR